MSLSAHDLLNAGLGLALLGVVAGVAVWAHRDTRRHRVEVEAMLARRGHVRSVGRRDGGGPVTRLWGLLPEPTPIYLRVLNNDGMAVAVGDLLGVADLKVGDPRFDGNFVVRSNFPDAARAVLDADMRRRLMGQRHIDFSTGAISNLLGPDFLQRQTQDRDLRTVWSLRVDGELSDEQCQPLLALAQDLVARLQQQAAQGGFVSADYRVGRLEGR